MNESLRVQENVYKWPALRHVVIYDSAWTPNLIPDINLEYSKTGTREEEFLDLGRKE
jgi:hypothetical protein